MEQVSSKPPTIPKIAINDKEVELTLTAESSISASNVHDCCEKPESINAPCEVVVSGASCRLPESENMEEFWYNLSTSTDMVTTDDRRWKPGLYGLPERNGKLKDLVHFDADFFRMKPFQAHAMDPQLRLLLEVTQEAIIDAGYNPSELRGTDTSVFVGSMITETYEASGSVTAGSRLGHGFMGANDAMFPNSISYYFDFKGPSLSINTACSSSLTCLDLAAKSILSGQCQYAIAAGVNILLKPGSSLHMLKLGALSPDGSCKSFDASANGYVRSEGIVSVLLSSRKLARRNYVHILNSRSSHDGYKSQAISYPSGEEQIKLIRATHTEIKLDPRDVYYVEAHGTGTTAGDYEECKALDGIFVSPGERARKQPLFIGSVKSNMGHSEPTSGLAGMVKLILSFRQGIIPPNLHLKIPNPRIASIVENRLAVVTKPTPMPSNAIVGINSFGFGGATSHAILKGGGETKKEGEETKSETMEKVALAFPVSSRTETGLSSLMDFIEANRTNKELLTLISSSMTNTNIDQYPYRGYVLWNDKKCTRVIADVDSYTADLSSKPPVWFVFAGMGSQWPQMGKELLQYPIFASTLQRCYDVLPSTVANLITSPVLASTDASMTFINEVVAICAVSLAQYELLKAVGIEPDYLVGHSLGELVLCYADGALTLEQCMLVAYLRSMCTIDADIPSGAMAAVGLPWNEVAARCPEGVWLACNNAKDNVTISGRKEAVKEFTAMLEEEKVITRMVKCSDIAAHSPLLKPAMNSKTLEILKGIIPSPKAPSKKWVITSVPEDKQENLLCSAEFHIQGAMSPVFFYEAIRKIPRNAVVIEIGPHALLHAPLKRTVRPGTVMIQLQNRKQKDQDVLLMNALGSCYNAGLNINPLALLKPVKLPVGCQTPSIGHLMSWDHSEEWFVPKPEDFISNSQTSKLVVTKTSTIDPKHPIMFESLDLSHYKIDGDVAIPASFYLVLVWELLAEFKDTTYSEMSVEFKDVLFYEMAFLSKRSSPLVLTTTILTFSGYFEVYANDQGHLVTGQIFSKTENTNKTTVGDIRRVTGKTLGVKTEDIYMEMALKGYELGDQFRVLSHSSDPTLNSCVIKPSSDLNGKPLAMLLEALFQMFVLHEPNHRVPLPDTLGCLQIYPQKLLSHTEKPAILYGSSNETCYTCTSNGSVHLTDLYFSSNQRKLTRIKPYIGFEVFQRYFQEHESSTLTAEIRKMIEIVTENINKKEIHVLQVIKASTEEECTLATELTRVVRAFFRAKILHDVLLVGSKSDNSLPEVTGHTYSIDILESRLPTEMQIYDLIFVLNTGPETNLPPSEVLLSKLAPNGFILVKETLSCYGEKCEDVSQKCMSKDLESLMCCVARQKYRDIDENESVIFLYHRSPEEEGSEEVAIVPIQSNDRSLSWFSKLKELLKKKDGPRRVYCISEYDPTNPSGLIGMVNCLKLEGYGHRLRCVYLADMSWKKFQTNCASTWLQIKAADLLVNVFMDNQYGSFHHIPLKPTIEQNEQTRFRCDSSKAYIITGGLGGFGLELANWLVDRDATYLILTSRSGIRNGYQKRKVEVMKGKNALVEVSNLDVSFEAQAFDLVRLALKKKPCCTIFHLAVVLKDGLFVNQTEENFKKVMAPKSVGAVNLDKALRELSTKYPDLKASQFVSFSSISSGFGNAGQTNYGFANSVLDRLSEQRVKDGLYGLSIQWGAIADVGAFQKSLQERNIKAVAQVGNTRPQPIGSCLYSLDKILHCNYPVVCCCIPDLKFDDKTALDSSKEGTTTTDSAFKVKLCSILGIRNPAKVKMETPMNQLGLDSITTTEVQSLLKEFDVTIEAQELSEVSMRDLVKKAVGESTSMALNVKTTVCHVLGIRNVAKINSDTPLSELGLDSLTASELRNSLEEKYNISIMTQDLPQKSIADLIKMTNEEGLPQMNDIQLSICHLLGIRNTQKVNMEAPLSELGLDSLSASEVYNLLERDYTITSISQSELPMMSLAGLAERGSEIQKSVSTGSVDSGIVTVSSEKLTT